MFAVVLFCFAHVADLERIPGPDGITLADAREFGVPPACVEGMWRLASTHADLMRQTVRAQNNEEVVCAWERDCAWRASVYDQLDNVLRCTMGYGQKMRCLARFRELIGEDAYDARVLPLPTPDYRGRP